MKQVQQLPVAARVYVDEAGIEDTLSWAYGWSRKGTRCLAERLGHRTCRVSMIAAWCQKQVLAPCTFQGYCDSLFVETWFEQCLLPVLKKGQVVILDNASFHRQAKLRALLLTVECELLPLPPYSPDLNKIEPLWNTLKRKVEKDTRKHPCFWDKIDAAFCSL